MSWFEEHAYRVICAPEQLPCDATLGLTILLGTSVVRFGMIWTTWTVANPTRYQVRKCPSQCRHRIALPNAELEKSKLMQEIIASQLFIQSQSLQLVESTACGNEHKNLLEH